MKNILSLLTCITIAIQVHAQHLKLLVGTYTNKGNSEGIYVYDYNSENADTKLLTVTKSANPSYLAISKDKKSIYAVNESGKESSVSAFSFDLNSGLLAFLNKKPSEGADPCHITVDQQHVFIANYSGGSIAIFGRKADGSLTDPKQIIKHTGKSIDPKRQTSAHVHQIQFTPDKKYLVVNDLGEDLIYVYAYNPNGGKQILKIKTVVKTTPGSGPRHLTFSPNGKFAYAVHEFTGAINSYTYANGNLRQIEETKTTPENISGTIDAADIHISSDGKFLYETNRGTANTISAFAILPTGTLRHIETISTLGKGPRNFAIDPKGNFLLVAHQYTNDIVIFNRDQITGKLSNSGKSIHVGTPVCLVFTN